MNKSALAIATMIAFTSAAFTTAAEAGRCGGGGFRSFGHRHVFTPRFSSTSNDYYARKRARQLAAAKLAEKRRIAEAKAEAARELAAKRRLAARIEKQRSLAAAAKAQAIEDKTKEVAEITPPTPEQKPATTVALATSAVPAVAANRNVGCKRYVPSAGLTISVPCE